MATRARLRPLALWLFVELWLFWFTAAVIIAAATYAWWDARESSIRLAGLMLQLIGVGSVLCGIIKTRKFFNLPPLNACVRDWWRRRPWGKRSGIAGGVDLTVGATLITGRATVLPEVFADAAVEARVEAVEKHLEALCQRVAAVEAEGDRARQAIEDALKRERHAWQADVRQVSDKHELEATGGLPIAAAGAFCILFGVVLSTAAPELAGLSNPPPALEAGSLARWLAILGLILGMAGVAMIFRYGPPQPSLELGVGLMVESGTVLPDGQTADDRDTDVARLRQLHTNRSRIGLALVFVGFAMQLCAVIFE
jgi:hypothetical protein